MSLFFEDEAVKALFGSLKCRRDNDLGKLVLADRFDEIGFPHMAHAFRWCGKHSRFPFGTEYPGRRGIFWWFRIGRRNGMCGGVERGMIPAVLFDLMRKSKHFSRGQYGSFEECFAALAGAFGLIHDTIEVSS